MDTNDATTFEVLKLSETFSYSILSFKTSLFDSFFACLGEDEVSNTIYKKERDDKHEIIWHKSNKDQSQKQTIIEFASAFDLEKKCEKAIRI